MQLRGTIWFGALVRDPQHCRCALSFAAIQLHHQATKVEEHGVDLDWAVEMPQLPSAASMRRIVARDPVAQARCFAFMMDIFCEEVLGILPPLRKGSYRVGAPARRLPSKMVWAVLCKESFLAMLRL